MHIMPSTLKHTQLSFMLFNAFKTIYFLLIKVLYAITDMFYLLIK